MTSSVRSVPFSRNWMWRLRRRAAESLVGRHVGKNTRPLHFVEKLAVNGVNLAIRFFVVELGAVAAAGLLELGGHIPGRAGGISPSWRRPRSSSSGRSSSHQGGSGC